MAAMHVTKMLSGLGIKRPPPSPAVPEAWLYAHARSHFAYFQDEALVPGERRLAFMENAGGSQVPLAVADAVRDYMLRSYAQLGAGYELSTRATNMVQEAHNMMKTFVNGDSIGEVVLGSSTSQLLAMIADCYSRTLRQSDEVIIHESAHEANVGPWERCARRVGCKIKFWKMDPVKLLQGPLDGLRQLLTPNTRIVAIAHVSNLLGEITDVEAVVKLVKGVAPSARVIVDGVAYAPHRAIDVAKWGCDWYVFSTYKVFSTHMAVLFGSHQAFAELKDEGPNHFWIPGDAVPYKFELGGPSHEACAGVVAMGDYLKALAACKDMTSRPAEKPQKHRALDRLTVEQAFDVITAMEVPLQTRLVKFLASRSKVSLIGPGPNGPPRVATVSFIHASKRSPDVSKAIQEAGFAVRHGHMYSYRLMAALPPKLLGSNSIEDGVVRVSMIHYNTPDEVDALCAALDKIL